MIITISGNAGSGKTTIANIISKKLSLKSYYIGGLRRDIARDKGMTLEEYNKLGETDPSTDNDVDDYQKKLGETEDNFIIQGRTSFHFIPNSIKLFIHVDIDEGAKRIWGDIQKDPEKRNEGDLKSLEDVKTSMKNRLESDKKRYHKYYGIDAYDESNYDLVVDTTNLTSDQAVEQVLQFIKDCKK